MPRSEKRLEIVFLYGPWEELSCFPITYYERTGENTSRTESSNSTTKDQCDGIRCDTANQTTKLKYANCGKVDVFDGEEGVEFSEEELEWGRRQQVRRTIPANIWERVKLIGNFGDSCGDDSIVL